MSRYFLPCVGLICILSCGGVDRVYKVIDPQDAQPRDSGVIQHDAAEPSNSDAGDTGTDTGVTEINVTDASLPIIAPPAGDYDFRATLFWDPMKLPSSADLDLHLLHPLAVQWRSTPYDCYYDNRRSVWDGSPAYSPMLDRDVITGNGPEDITIETIPLVEFGRAYRVGVLFFSNHGVSGSSAAYVQIACGGVVEQLGPVSLFDEDIWRVADVIFDSSGRCDIRLLGLVTHTGQDGYLTR